MATITAPTNYRSNYLAYGRTGDRSLQDQQISDAENAGQRGISDYLSGAEGFDASKSLNTYAQGAYGTISTALKKQLADLGGQAVGAGRFDSGFYDADQGVLVNNATSELSNDIAQQSMNAAQLQQRNTESLGQFGQNQQGEANDLTASRYEFDENNAREDAAQKRARKSGLWGTIGGALGAGAGFFSGGGLAGAKAGWGIGSALGSAAGNL